MTKLETKQLLHAIVICIITLTAIRAQFIDATTTTTGSHNYPRSSSHNSNNSDGQHPRNHSSSSPSSIASGASIFNHPELNQMGAECLVRASCKLRHQQQLRPQPLPADHAEIDPFARIVSCYCDNKCHLYDDCCSDAQDFTPTTPSNAIAAKPAAAAAPSSTSTSDGSDSESDSESESSSSSSSSSSDVEENDETQDEIHRVAEVRNRWHCQRVNGNLGGMQLLSNCPPNWAEDLPDMTVKLARFIERRCTFVANPNLSNNDSLLADYQMDPLGMMMPITDLRSGITYANSYCLRCNSHSRLFGFDHNKLKPKLVPWSPILDCNYNSEHDDRNTLYDLITQHRGNALQYSQQLNKWIVNTKLLEEELGTTTTTTPSPNEEVSLSPEAGNYENTSGRYKNTNSESDPINNNNNTISSERTCTIAPSAPDEVKPLLRYCHSSAIRWCAVPKHRNSALSRVCQFGPQSILFSKTSDRVYHNLACALCNGENSTSINCLPSRRRHMMGEPGANSLEKLFPDSLRPMLNEAARSASPFATSFSILFDLSGQTNAASIPGSVTRCKGVHQIYDPFFMTCRCLMCGLNREFRDGKCVTKQQRMAENMAFAPMPMRMLPGSGADSQTSGDSGGGNGEAEVTLSSPSNDNEQQAPTNTIRSPQRPPTANNQRQQVGLQMLIPKEMPESMRPASRMPQHHRFKKQNSVQEQYAAWKAKNMSDQDAEFEKLLMNLNLADLPEPSIESREKFALCGKLTVMPQHYRLFTLSDRLSIGAHPNRQPAPSKQKRGPFYAQPQSDNDSSSSSGNEPETPADDTAFMLLNGDDQKHQKRRHARSGTYALRIWAYVKPYNLLLPSSQFELVRPDLLLANYEMGEESADLLEDQDQRFDLLICAPFKNDLAQKFSLSMAYVTSVCLTISIASLTLYLILYVFSMFNLSHLLKAQRDDRKPYHKLSVRSETSGYCPSSVDNFPDSPSVLKQFQMQQTKQHPLGGGVDSNNYHQQQAQYPPARQKRALSEAPSVYSSSNCRRKSLSSQGVACLATSLLAAYLLFILNNQYVSNKKDAILAENQNNNPSSEGAQNQQSSNDQASSSSNQLSQHIQTDWGCKFMAIATIYCFLVAFNWMLLLSYDIWRSVRLATVHLRPPSNNYNGKRFMSYLTFSLVSSGCIVGLALLTDEMPQLCMDESGNFSCSVIESTINQFVRDFRPHFGYSGPTNVCWFNSRKSLALFFGFPVTIIVAINLIYFVLCSFMVIKTTSRTSKHSAPGGIMAPKRQSISGQPKFVVQRTDFQNYKPKTNNMADPFARRAHAIGPDQANIYGSKRSATTTQSSLISTSYLSSLNDCSTLAGGRNGFGAGPGNGGIAAIASGCNAATGSNSSTESSSPGCSIIGDGDVTPPIETMMLAGLDQQAGHLTMAEIIREANAHDAHPPTFDQLNAANLSNVYQRSTNPADESESSSHHYQVIGSDQFQPMTAHPTPTKQFESQASSNSLLSNASSVGGASTTGGYSFATTIASKYDARKHQLSSMMQTVIQDYRLYCRLTTMMGLTWLIGILAAIVDKSMLLWHLFIIFNTLQGFFIFVSFGLKREKLRNVNILLSYIKFRLRKLWTQRLLMTDPRNSSM